MEGSPDVYTIYMDYTLYRNFDEQEPTYDYFAVKTNAWVTKLSARTDSLDGIFTKYDLPKVGDNLLETGPQTKEVSERLT